MIAIEFEKVRPKLIDAMEKLDFNKYGIMESVSLVDGFITPTLHMQLSNSIANCGAVVPLVMLLGNESGRVYLFAVKALISIK